MAAQAAAPAIAVHPHQVTLDGGFERCQVLVRPATPDGTDAEAIDDLTGAARFSSASPDVATVSDTGVVSAVGNGSARIEVSVGDATATVEVVVSGVVAATRADFERDVLPVLTRAGCNAGTCHASQYGKGGFVLSVMAFDPEVDFNSIAIASRGRRICPTNPDGSLLLGKASNRIPHGGGTRLAKDSADYALLATWIAAGAPGPAGSSVAVTGLEVEPAKRVAAPGATQQIRVVATYTDGRRRDVTGWARFDAMDEGVVKVSPTGVATTVGKGQGAVMARFGGEATIATFVVPFAAAADLSGWTSPHPLDVVAGQKFAEIGLTPSGLCDDATFLRRAFLDSIGGLPTADEARAFHASTAADKRERLVDELLGLTGDPARDRHVDRYAAWWSLKWADLIRNNSAVLGESGMWALHNWLRESFRTNKPFDRFVTELITAKGSIFASGPANYFRIANNPSDLAESTAQLFLGTRLQCAKCHHHPYERISQADYYGFAAFFARVASKNSAEFGIFGGETIVVVNPSGEVSHPRSGAVMKPTPLEGEPMENAEGIPTTWRRSVLLVLAITLHNIPEGLAVGVAFGAVAYDLPSASLAGAIALAIGIGIQNFPEGAAVSVPLRREGMSRRKCFWYGQLSGVVEPIAGVIGAATVMLMRPILPYALSFAAGAMIFVVVEELIPESQSNKNTDIATMGAMLGFAIMMMLDVALG
jgi:zinc transporter ZupT